MAGVSLGWRNDCTKCCRSRCNARYQRNGDPERAARVVPMCLMMYLGADTQLIIRKSPDLSIEPLTDDQQVVRTFVRKPYVYFVGSHSGCSCGFPSVAANSPVPCFDGMFDETAEGRTEDVASVRELLTVVDECLQRVNSCVLWPVWNGEEASPPKGDVDWNRNDLTPETFVVTERYRYTIHSDPVPTQQPDSLS